MTTPNPSSVFGRRLSPRMPESTPMSTCFDEGMVTPAELELTVDESANARSINYTLGNHELPISLYREQIVDAVGRSQATIITAETGAGKSTQVPQFLAEQGYEVIVTQPRIVAARSVAERVGEEVVSKKGAEFSKFVGYRTARERGDSPENQILFATDGLQLVRELSGHGVGKKQVLVLDEVHEWNENMEVLVAWAKQHMNEDPNFKVVVMSATMEAGPLAQYFAEDGKREVPVIEVPGRTYEVKKEEGGDVANEAIKFARNGKNTLVFVPGKAEIDQVMAEIGRANIPGVTILPLHGQLEASEQRKVFARYPGVKIIVATNIAETSVTIEDIDAVVDSGLERRQEVRNGVEGLYLSPISQANCLQRAGRAGRTKDGEYVLAQLGNNPFVALKDREAYGTPEILRTRLDGMVLRLAKNGLDAATMEFFHSKDEHGRDINPEIAAAKLRLQKLGALREDGSITKIGRDMERMPVESHYARMMIEARKYGPEVQIQLVAMLAVQEADGITQFDSRNKPSDERWRSLLQPGVNDSDMIKQLEVFIAAQTMSDREKRDNDIFVKAFSKANEVLRQLRGVEKLRDQDLVVPTAEQREQLVKCIISGMVDNLYVNDYYGHRDAKGNVREVSTRSIIRPGKMVVGKPFDLQINTRRGPTTLNLLESPTNVPSVGLLREVAPQLFSEESVGYAIGDDGSVRERFKQVFNGHDTEEIISRKAAESLERKMFLARKVAEQQWYSSDVRRIIQTVDDLNNRVPGAVGVITFENLLDVTVEAMPLSVATIGEALEYVPQFELDDLVSPDECAEIYAKSPDEFDGRSLVYGEGMPMITGGLSEDEILGLDVDKLVLPDGRKIGLKDTWNMRSIDIAQYQEQILKNRAERAEREAREYESRVREALYYLNSAYARDRVVGWFGEEATNEAEQRLEMQQAANEAARREEQVRRQAQEAEAAERRRMMSEEIDALLRMNEQTYGRTRLAGLDDAPETIVDGIYAIQDELDIIKGELEEARVQLSRGDSIEIHTYADSMTKLRQGLARYAQEFADWREEQKRLEASPASTEDLAALMAKFNKH